MKKAIELIRVSTEAQAAEDRAGIPAQRAVNRRTAAQNGLTIVKTIEITDVSGTAVLQAPGMRELLRLIESPEIHGVVAKEFSRLMRPENFGDYVLLQQFIDSKTVLYLPDGPLDFASESGKLLGGIRALIAGQERREMLRRLQDAKEAMRRAGKNAGGSSVLPFGVGYSKERGWYYTPEVEKVKSAFQLFLAGMTSYEAIGRELNIPRQSVRYILENPIYTGWRVYDKRRDSSPEAYISGANGQQGYRRKIRRSAEEVIRVRVLDPIVSEEDFGLTQQVIETKRRKHWRVRKETPNRYTYNGFLICDDCGQLIYTHTSKDEFYCCKSRHPRERRKRDLNGLIPCENTYMLRKKLEPKIDHVLADIICKRSFLERVVNEYNESLKIPVPTHDQAGLTTNIHTLKEKRQRVLDTFFEGIIDKQQRDSRLEQIEKEIVVFEGLLMKASGGFERQCSLDLRTVLAIVEPFVEWAFLNRDQKRKLLASLCPDIRVHRYEIKKLQLNVGVLTDGGYETTHSRTGT